MASAISAKSSAGADALVDPYLAAMQAALADADATLSTDLGGERTITTVRLWRDQALVDWEPDPSVGDCLFRPALVRRLVDLHAAVHVVKDGVVVEAPGQVVASLSPEHSELVQRMGGARRVHMTVTLSFADGLYEGGTQAFEVVERGRRLPFMQLTARIKARAASPRTSPART